MSEVARSVVDLTGSTLDELAVFANEQHGFAAAAAANMVEYAIRAGEALTMAASHLAPGEVQPWIESNVSFSYRTAKTYMRLAHYREAIEEAGEVTLDGARLLVRGLPPIGIEPGAAMRMPDEIRDEARRLYAQGESKVAIAETLGVSRRSVHEWVDDDARKRKLAYLKAFKARRREERKALVRQERDRAVAKAGGAEAAAYALLRRCLSELDRARIEATDAESRDALRWAITHAQHAEDCVVKALRLSRRLDG